MLEIASILIFKYWHPPLTQYLNFLDQGSLESRYSLYTFSSIFIELKEVRVFEDANVKSPIMLSSSSSMKI